jgi:glycosyltransferase involved in cell wall biosynthesis
LRKKILQNIDRVFFISEHGRKYLEEKFPFFKKIYDLSYLGVKERTRQKGKNDIPILISCSNIIPIKRVDLIIKSLALMKDHSFVWYHIGDGVGGSEIRKLAQNLLRKGTYSFLGRLTNEQVMEFYSNTLVDLFISTSLSEGLPVSMMEAMSFGIPVIGTNVGGVSEIVNSENGMLLSEKPNAQEVANAILEIIIRPEEKAEVLRRNAYDMWNKKFNAKNNYENFARKIGNLFDP